MSLGVTAKGRAGGRAASGRTDPGTQADRADAARATVELRALAHPIRLRILSLLTGAAMTAADVARELNLTHANASYHLRQLHAAAAIEVAGEERIRGGVAKRYRYVVDRDDVRPSAAPPSEAATGESLVLSAERETQRRLVYTAMAMELRQRAKHSRHVPGRSYLTDADLWVDPEVWGEIIARVAAASADLHRAAQAPRTAGTIRVNASLALFQMESAA